MEGALLLLETVSILGLSDQVQWQAFNMGCSAIVSSSNGPTPCAGWVVIKRIPATTLVLIALFKKRENINLVMCCILRLRRATIQDITIFS